MVAIGCSNDEVAVVEDAEEIGFEDDDMILVGVVVGVTNVESSLSFGFLIVGVAIATEAGSTLPIQGIVQEAAAESAGEPSGGSDIGFTQDVEEEEVVALGEEVDDTLAPTVEVCKTCFRRRFVASCECCSFSSSVSS